MTGPLVLAPGAPAAPEQAANKAYVDAVVPIGTIFEYAGTSLPDRWLWCNGNTYTDTSKPALAAAIGRNFTATEVPAGSFQVPDKRGRVGIGFDATVPTQPLGKTGGQRDSELQQHLHTVPVHSHTATTVVSDQSSDHVHGGSTLGTSNPGDHTHGQGHGVGYVVFASPNGGANLGVGTTWGVSPAWRHEGGHVHSITGNTGGISAAHKHTVTATIADKPAFNTENAGIGTTLTDKNLPPYVVCNYIIYAGA
jgi:microcystin-dependent protein